MLLITSIVILTLLILYFIATSDLDAIYKFGLAVIELGIVGIILRKIVKPTKNWELDGEWGLLLLKTKKGLKIIEGLAKNKKLWNYMADVGLVAGYGFLSLLIMRKHLDWKKFLAGIILLTILSMFIVPYALPFLITNLKGQIMSDAMSDKYATDEVTLFGSFIVTYGFGLFGVVFAGIANYGIIILSKLVGVFLGMGEIASQDAGVTLIIPGINIPLIEGIIALFIILVVHEGAHAILGRIARVPLLSSGIVLFGVIPIGAFVEPDEEWLKKLEEVKQTRVMIAGPTANFITAILAFILFFSFLSLTEDYREQGMFVVDGMEYGTVVYSINGIDIKENMNLTAGEMVLVQTNNGEIEREVNEEGLIGIQGYHLGGPFIVKYTEWWMSFIYVTLGFAFSLNFVIGIVNLLPIPAFDGHRILQLNIKNKEIVRFLTYVAIIGLLMNFLPWFF